MVVHKFKDLIKLRSSYALQFVLLVMTTT